MPDRRCGARGFWIAVSLTHNPPVLERRSGSRSVADTLESAFRTHGKASISTRVRSTNGVAVLSKQIRVVGDELSQRVFVGIRPPLRIVALERRVAHTRLLL